MTPDAIERLCKLLGMLGSNHDGERAAAGLKAHQLMKRRGLTWTDVIMVPADVPQPPPQPPNWRVMVHQCLVARAMLNPKELAFVRNLVAWQGTPSPRQIAWLTRIYRKHPIGRSHRIRQCDCAP